MKVGRTCSESVGALVSAMALLCGYSVGRFALGCLLYCIASARLGVVAPREGPRVVAAEEG
jgi:hypothetical protein